MGVLALIWGICAILGMMLAMIPLLGWLNWLVIPFAIIGLIISAIGMSGTRGNNTAAAGLILCLIATVLGGIRLVLGGFIV
ncbi:hypothetical protein CO614_09035 [Lysobacteraceae bacterium NML120232]|nr:hypothetical protein CO608_09190 [Xanthomonadaceae bacterium NML08-0793]PJK09697.1 hypothetical protein CO614_09035 [Xanthomonadaceae bacterium NML120232]